MLIRKHGADLNCVDKLGRTPLHWASFNGDTDLITMLLTSGAGILLFFPYLGLFPANFLPCETLSFKEINARDNDGYTPLHKAVWKGKLECVRQLLERGADISKMVI